jgi:hypothetical protein
VVEHISGLTSPSPAAVLEVADPLFTCHGAAQSHWPAHTQIQLVVELYVACYFVLLVGIVGFLAFEVFVRSARRDAREKPRSTGDASDGSPVDDWWDDLREGER